jgi:hypothetical protein
MSSSRCRDSRPQPERQRVWAGAREARVRPLPGEEAIHAYIAEDSTRDADLVIGDV